VRIDRQTLLRGVAKFIAVVLLAGFVGAGVGIALAKLSGNDGGEAPAPAAAVSATSAQTATTTLPTTTQTQSTGTSAGTETAAPLATVYRAPRVEVLSAQLGAPSAATGRAPVTAQVRVTNRGTRPLPVEAPTLLSVQDEVPLDPSGTAEAGPLLGAVAPGAGATGTLHFTLPAEVARRLTVKPAARLRMAGRIVALNLTTESR
jgi:hypothetical protein